MTTQPSAGHPREWRSSLPAAQWLRGYQRTWLVADLAAGTALAAYMLPGALGDASLAGLPPEAGLYSCLFSGLVFWTFCSSFQTSITVTSAISLLLGSTLGGLAGGDVTHFSALASGTALITAAIAFLAWLANAGSIVSFVSESVLVGFKVGVALYLTSTQLPRLCGIPSVHGDFWSRTVDFVNHIGQIHGYSLALGSVALVGILWGKKVAPRKPVALLVLIVSAVIGVGVDYPSYGVSLVGAVPRGVPGLAFPVVSGVEIRELLPLGLACFLLGAVETASIGRMFASPHQYRFNGSQEFLALCGANLAAGLGHGYPVSGGMSQSMVNESSGARTPLSGLVAAAWLCLVTLFCSDLLSHLPQPVLAAVVIGALTRLIRIDELLRLWRLHRSEFLVALAALLGVLAAGLLLGVLVGAIISLALLLRRVSAAHVAFLGRIPGTRRYSDSARHESNEPIAGVVAFRVEAAIWYFNQEHVHDTVLDHIDQLSDPPRLVVCDLSNAADVDIAGARMLLTLHTELQRRGIHFRVVEARSHVRDMLRVEGVEEAVGKIDRFTPLADVIDEFQST